METQAVALVNEISNNIIIVRYLGAVILVAIGSYAVALAQGKITVQACESIANNEKAEAAIKNTFFMGMIFVETCVIYCLLIAMILLLVL